MGLLGAVVRLRERHTGVIRWVAAGATHPGRVRERNEDAFRIASGVPLWVVADGLGGHRGGERASRVAVDEVVEAFLKGKGGASARLRKAVEAAHRAVLRDADDQPDRQGMGCTLVAAAAAHNLLHVCHAGDVRCYVGQGGELVAVTRDHSAVAELGLDPGELHGHPMRHVVTRAVGVDLAGGPECSTWPLEGVDRILLCTDGLWSVVPGDVMCGVLYKAPDPQSAADRLVRLANHAGGRDNVTVIVVFRRG